MKINVARFLSRSQSEGPGWRSVIWVQGCPILCKGCINQEMLPFIDREWTTVDKLAERILAVDDIEGITFLGGEPFAQAEALAQLAKQVREHGLSVMTFSGYTLEELQDKEESGVAELLNQTDLLITGPFIEEQSTLEMPWVGSRNQEYHFLTERYRHLQDHIMTLYSNSVEIRLTPNQVLDINGLFGHELINTLRKHLKSNEILLNTPKGGNTHE
jgi:anaerobic ribonucleoside-triphosphate reductase activating protein